MAEVFKKTRFTICIPEELGGSGNPSIPTARGVVKGMEAALAFLNSGDLKGKTIAIQGVGNVGGPLIGFLLEKNVSKIIACDIKEKHVEKVKKEYLGENLEVHTVPRDDSSILAAECDILSPNATGAILNPQTIPKIQAKIVCGAANNQLEDAARDDRLLLEQGITYVPDFLANRMGIVYAANEQYGYVNPDPVIEKHLSPDWEHSLFQTTLRVLNASQKTGEATGQIAVSLADKLSLELHPIFGHRGQQIIDSLVADDWQTILSKGERRIP
jgi:glutamate dehydrogenase/leucine dehydrogenase